MVDLMQTVSLLAAAILVLSMRAENRRLLAENETLRSARRRTAAVLLRVKRERDDKGAAVRELVADIWEREREEERRRAREERVWN